MDEPGGSSTPTPIPAPQKTADTARKTHQITLKTKDGGVQFMVSSGKDVFKETSVKPEDDSLQFGNLSHSVVSDIKEVLDQHRQAQAAGPIAWRFRTHYGEGHTLNEHE